MNFLPTALVIAALATYVLGQSTEITYQGQLQSSSAPASGSFDFEFVLFDSGGSQIGPVLTRNGVAVSGGVFSVNLDFGSGFPGATRFLEIRVRQSGGGAFTTLLPRQPVTSSPYSIKSLTADNADNAANATNALTATNFSGSLAGDVTGTQSNNRVVRLQNQNVASTPPLNGQVLKFNSTTGQWTPDTDNTGSGGGGGTITGVTAGTGLTGGGATGNVTLGIGPGGVGTGQLAEGSVVDSKIVTVSGSKVTGVIGIANGGTGSSTRNFVDLTSTENVGGSKTFTNPVNTLTQYNIDGSRAFSVAGSNNLFAGLNAGTGGSNSGIRNAFVGSSAGATNSTGNQNSFFGFSAGFNNTTGSNNSFFGTVAGQINTVGEYNTVVGSGANLNAGNRVFTTLIGANALATGNDEIVLGKVAGTYFVNGANTSRPADTVRIPGDLVVAGTLSASINGSTITNLNASNIASGTLNNARLGQIPTANIADSAVTSAKIAGGQVVKGLNGITDNITLAAGSNITITPSGNTLTIASTGGGGGVSGSGTTNTIPLWNGSAALGNSQIVQLGANVGIGNPSPFFKLDVDGLNAIRGSSTSGVGTSGVTTSGIGVYGLAATGDAGLFDGRVRVSGNLGIGTTAVGTTDKLTVQTATSNYGVVHTDGTIAVGSYVGGSTGGGWLGTRSNHPLSFFINNSSPMMTIGTNGNVGIGTTTPSAKLAVISSGIGVSGSSTNLEGVLGNSTNGTGVVGLSTSGIGIGAASGGGGIALKTNGTSFFKGDTTPLSAANAGSGTGIAIGSAGTLGYISAFDYGVFQARDLLINNSGGRVSINTNTLDQTLTVNGNASKVGGGSWLAFSDERLKNIKGRFNGGLKAVKKLQPLRYEYKADNAIGLRSDGQHIGFSAQAVEKVLPEAVTKTEAGYRLVNNDPIIFAMLNAIKEQQATMEKLTTQLQQLRRAISKKSRKR